MISEMILVFGRIGLISFGGPAAQIGLMHKELVEDRHWLTEEQFLRALSFCMLLPGPEAMQLATYAGWTRAGVIGGLIGGGLFVLPGAMLISVLALAYSVYGNLPAVEAVFVGIKAAVVIIVIDALIKVSKRALKTALHTVIAILALFALFLFAVPFPIVIAVAALIGAATQQTSAVGATRRPNFQHSGYILLSGFAIWILPLGALYFTGPEILTTIGTFFSKLAIVSFGGAYAVLAYMSQEVVGTYHWLSTPQMIDALGLAETTPGPLILVTQFVGMLAAHSQGGIGLALAAGTLTLWATFVPCFIWIFAGAPLIEWLGDKPRLEGALAGITAAVVGVIASLSLWFAVHVAFEEITQLVWGPITTLFPVWKTVQPVSLVLICLAWVMLVLRRWPLPLVLLISASLSLIVVGG